MDSSSDKRGLVSSQERVGAMLKSFKGYSSVIERKRGRVALRSIKNYGVIGRNTCKRSGRESNKLLGRSWPVSGPRHMHLNQPRSDESLDGPFRNYL